MELQDIIKNYPDALEVFKTSDGIIHLTKAGAAAQANHLENKVIEPISCKKTTTSRKSLQERLPQP